MTMVAQQQTTEFVREFYTTYPYPDPRYVAESRTPLSALLDYVKNLYWPFRPSLAGVRVLDAGCGTGVAALSLARRFPEVDVTAIDLSAASLDLARTAAKERGLKNVSFHQATLLDAATFGSFQYIVASGVVHHMADPVAGFDALRNALTPDGVLMAMVYAQYGRTGVYMLQEAFRRLAPEGYRTVSPATARAIASNLPAGHLFDAERFVEMDWQNECGVVDLLLHPQDRAYTVPQIVDHCQQAGLRLQRFVSQTAYEPTTYPLPAAEAARAAALPDYERWALGELLNGNMVKHEFYATRDTFEPVRIKPEGAILMAVRILRSPTWDWAAAREVRADDGSPTFELREWVASAGGRLISLQPWQMELIQSFDGRLTALELFGQAGVNALIPGDDQDAKLRLYGNLLQMLVEQEVLLADPS